MSSYDEHLITLAGGDALTAADDAYTAAVQAAVSGAGDWEAVKVAGHAVRQARAARTGPNHKTRNTPQEC